MLICAYNRYCYLQLNGQIKAPVDELLKRDGFKLFKIGKDLSEFEKVRQFMISKTQIEAERLLDVR